MTQISLQENVRTAPATRAEIAASSETAAVFAQRYGITGPTVYQWKARQGFRAANTTQQIVDLRLRRGAKPQAVQAYDKAKQRRIKGCVSGS